ncbi:hypothetical protein ILUMI_21391 [Ignelater luminosus]|uniref:Uncharacterized protein n=1 Tax=Ignelater luminosus TaxID=2038154 RepID=A0A8K0CCI7_IGNLU|nr:hypothetical protein ILUMI_21391 [Ignelater luminosus]
MKHTEQQPLEQRADSSQPGPSGVQIAQDKTPEKSSSVPDISPGKALDLVSPVPRLLSVLQWVLLCRGGFQKLVREKEFCQSVKEGELQSKNCCLSAIFSLRSASSNIEMKKYLDPSAESDATNKAIVGSYMEKNMQHPTKSSRRELPFSNEDKKVEKIMKEFDDSTLSENRSAA